MRLTSNLLYRELTYDLEYTILSTQQFTWRFFEPPVTVPSYKHHGIVHLRDEL